MRHVAVIYNVGISIHTYNHPSILPHFVQQFVDFTVREPSFSFPEAGRAAVVVEDR